MSWARDGEFMPRDMWRGGRRGYEKRMASKCPDRLFLALEESAESLL